MPDPQITIARAAVPVTVLTAEEDGARGLVEAIVSAYDVRYRIGFATYHTIKPGAFAASIAEQAAIPLFWMHAWDWTEQPPIGHGLGEEVESPKPGLKIAGELYLDQPGVASIFRAMKAGALREWSIGYRPLAWDVDPADDLHQMVTEAELMEASSVLRGANPETETLRVASERVTFDQRTGTYLISGTSHGTPTAPAGPPAGAPTPPGTETEAEQRDEPQIDDLAAARSEIAGARLARRARHALR